jgi:hypothetical protein
MTWLSDEDRALNKQMEQSAQENENSTNVKVTKISITKDAEYPYLPSTTKFDLPKTMTFDEARQYANSIGHDRISYFYDANGSEYEEKQYPHGYSSSNFSNYK